MSKASRVQVEFVLSIKNISMIISCDKKLQDTAGRGEDLMTCVSLIYNRHINLKWIRRDAGISGANQRSSPGIRTRGAWRGRSRSTCKIRRWRRSGSKKRACDSPPLSHCRVVPHKPSVEEKKPGPNRCIKPNRYHGDCTAEGLRAGPCIYGMLCLKNTDEVVNGNGHGNQGTKPASVYTWVWWGLWDSPLLLGAGSWFSTLI